MGPREPHRTSHGSRVTGHGFFVTGTDTGVGKTLVACALLQAFAARGLRTAGMKPVAAGAAPGPAGLVNDDVEQILAAASVAVPRALVNPYCFAPPIAPHLAAREAGVEIDLALIGTAYRQIAAGADIVVVEGAGGLLVPLNDREDMTDLARLLGLRVILVVGARLGCLNHALLTVEAVHARGLELAGWIANHIDPCMTHADGNVATLDARIAAPRLARIAHRDAPDPRRIADEIDLRALVADA